MADWRAWELRNVADREQRRVDTLRQMADNLDAGVLIHEGLGVRCGAAQEAVALALDAGPFSHHVAARAEHGRENGPARHGDSLGVRE